jgi:sugar O-acyltransferase (sialic acid O-acetyltransferase NeuD family)
MLAIYGAGGFALQIMDLIDAVAETGEEVCFVDDRLTGDLFGIPVRAFDEVREASFAIAVSNPTRRREIAARIERPRPLHASTSITSPHSRVGDGSILCHHTIIEAGAIIGAHFHGNIYSYVAHESVIGDFVTFAPRVNCNGAVRIGDGAYIGTGAFLKQGISIGAGAIVGMGAVVLGDVPAGATVVGNPGRIRL